MDLALNNLQKLICLKTQTTNQPVFHGFLYKLYDFVEYLVQFKTVYYRALRDHIVCPFVINQRHSYIFASHKTEQEEISFVL